MFGELPRAGVQIDLFWGLKRDVVLIDFARPAVEDEMWVRIPVLFAGQPEIQVFIAELWLQEYPKESSPIWVSKQDIKGLPPALDLF